ncbi:MAG: hypothetical protein MH204_04400 [Fimbriimonadaceae bacterium]|nr:hypothetical protein [Fimbriimonadaceae bacterium]
MLTATLLSALAAGPTTAAPALTRSVPGALTLTRTRTLAGLRAVQVTGSPVGDLVAVSLESGEVRLIDANTGQTRRSLLGHPQPVYGAAFSSDGKTLITGDDSARIWIWNVATGQKIREMPREKGHQRGIQAIEILSGGRFATVGKDDTVRVWNIAGGHPIQTILGNGANFYGVGQTPSGALVLGTLKEGMRLYGRSTQFSLAAALSLPGGQGANDISVNRAGTLAVTAGRDGIASVWTISSRSRSSFVRAHDDWVIAASFAPSGRVFATSSNDRTIKLWNPQSQPLGRLDDMSAIGSPLAWTGSGKFLIGTDIADQPVIIAVSPAQAPPAPPRPRSRRGR